MFFNKCYNDLTLKLCAMSTRKTTHQFLIKNLNWHLILTTCCLGGVIGIALKLIVLFNHWIYLPFFPNICDSMFLILAVTYLSYNCLKNQRKTENE